MTPNEAQIERLCKAFGVPCVSHLSGVLGVGRPALGNARQRGVPYRWLLVCLDQTSTNPNWIRTGQEPRYMLPVHSSAINANQEASALDTNDMLDGVERRQMPEADHA